MIELSSPAFLAATHANQRRADRIRPARARNHCSLRPSRKTGLSPGAAGLDTPPESVSAASRIREHWLLTEIRDGEPTLNSSRSRGAGCATIRYESMAREARVVAVGVPHHLTQWGNNRLDGFLQDCDRRLYLETVRRGASWDSRLTGSNGCTSKRLASVRPNCVGRRTAGCRAAAESLSLSWRSGWGNGCMRCRRGRGRGRRRSERRREMELPDWNA